MIRKLFIFLKYDGFHNTGKYIYNLLMSRLYRKVETDLLYIEKENASDFKLYSKDDTEILIPTKEDEVRRNHNSRLKLTPWEEWFKNGSKLILLKRKGKTIGYGWLHKKEYEVHNIGKIIFSEDTAWLGPFFINKQFRGLGLQKKLILELMARSSASVFLTSVNSTNIPSVKSFQKLGFKEIGKGISKIVFNREKMKRIEMYKNLPNIEIV